MSPRVLVGLGLVTSVCLGACVLATDFDGFHNPAASANPNDSGPATDSGKTTEPDAQTSVEAGPPVDAGDPNVIFADDFNRADGPVGNGWLDPTKSYRIRENQLPVTASGWAFQNNTLYQPKRDDALNIKASIEYRPLSLPPSYPQVHIRAEYGKAKCYAAGIPQEDRIFFGRCVPNDFLDLGDQMLSENIIVGRTYRLSISAKGTSPVHLTMDLERKTDTGFVSIGHHEIDDGAPERITEPGAFGISGDTAPNWVYDNFVATKIAN